MEAQPHPGAQPQWTVSVLQARIQEISFPPGTTLDPALLHEISTYLLSEEPEGGIRALIHLSGLADVCPEAAPRLSKSKPSTRLALLGQSRVDRVLAGFMLADMCNSSIAKYVTSLDEALAYLTDGEPL
jgi:hypothetical protein